MFGVIKMSSNPPSLRPDLLMRNCQLPAKASRPSVWFRLVSPKALVDSERILTRLRAEGYGTTGLQRGADAVIVNTCGFLDSATRKPEAIGSFAGKWQGHRHRLSGGRGRVYYRRASACSGCHRPQQYEQVLDAVHSAAPPSPDPFIDLLPATGVKLAPGITAISRFPKAATTSANSASSLMRPSGQPSNPCGAARGGKTVENA